ncbi:MAG: hypothetical protein KJ749_08495, partial [Planctomycetes bacterium]|nr:hypothetical protein [Planctomycetota bacterium]
RFESMTRDAKAVRGVAFCRGNLFASIDDRIIAWPADEVTDCPTRICTGSATTISSLCPNGDDLFAGNSNGDILHWPAGQDSGPETIHRGAGRAAESVWLLTTQGIRRLVFTDTSISIHARVLGDSFVCRYEAGGQTLRRAEIAADVIVALNELRDRLICWVPGKPDHPQETIAISRICGRSVQDICLVSMS